MPRIEQFWKTVDKRGPNDCWEWQGRRNPGGYGKFGKALAHRVAFWLIHGRWPMPSCLHSCPGGDNPACCNPAHLREGTHKDNAEDARQRGQLATGKRHGTHTHPESRTIGTRCRQAKLNDEMVKQILQRIAHGESKRQIALDFGVTTSAIEYIDQSNTWKHVPRPEKQHDRRLTNTKLCEWQVMGIMARWLQGNASFRQIGREFGVGHHSVIGIIRGENWDHLFQRKDE